MVAKAGLKDCALVTDPNMDNINAKSSFVFK
jgi:hypothetical protein